MARDFADAEDQCGVPGARRLAMSGTAEECSGGAAIEDSVAVRRRWSCPRLVPGKNETDPNCDAAPQQLRRDRHIGDHGQVMRAVVASASPRADAGACRRAQSREVALDCRRSWMGWASAPWRSGESTKGMLPSQTSRYDGENSLPRRGRSRRPAVHSDFRSLTMLRSCAARELLADSRCCNSDCRSAEAT